MSGADGASRGNLALLSANSDHVPMMRAIGAALAFLTLFVIAGCGGGEDPTGCMTSADCPGGRCVDGTCEALPACVDADCDDGNPCNGVESCGTSRCQAGTPAPDGAACDADGDPGTSDICTDEACAPARCGDAFVDTAGGEECDDGNGTSGDGCDDCSYSCTSDTSCDDGDECNGPEVCNLAMHACRAGTSLADGTDCAGTVGRCMAGRCVPKNCSMPAECDDADACTGVEACTAMACVAGTPLDCADGTACTADSCAPSVGCIHMLVDADRDGHAPSSLGACGDDCDDTNPLIYAGSADGCDGLDNDCDMLVDEDEATLWFADCDGDNFAPMGGTSITSCARPAATLTGCAMGSGAWVTRAPVDALNADCNDANATVFPTQTMFQSTGIAGAAPAVDFDYDCNGTEQQNLTTVGTCRLLLSTCRRTAGWMGTVPECGATGSYLATCTYVGGSCRATGTMRVQACL